MRFLLLASGLALISRSFAQFPPQPVGVTSLQSKIAPGASLSYKETHICETTHGVRSYSGYVNLPDSILQLGFNISTFYWYFEARHNPSTAPLVIYLAGGAGESSLLGAISSGGPCSINSDANSTTLNPWSWNNDANVLYIDQPVQTGFSYTALVNGTLDQLTAGANGYTQADFSAGIPSTNATFLVGTFSDQGPDQTTNNSAQSAHVLYHFTQVWTNEFPEYKARDHKISVWANSWGGFYGPAAFAYMERQNEAIKVNASTLNPKYRILKLDSLGILNGCMDPVIEAPHYAQYAYNNTYGLQAFSEDLYNALEANVTKPGGCVDLSNQCRELAAEKDPQFTGSDPDVNAACSGALAYCVTYAEGWAQPPFIETGIDNFDISHPMLDPYPYNTGVSTYFNRAWVQEALGVPLNFSLQAYNPGVNYVASGDAIRGNKTNLEYVLSRGKRVVLIFGDRDFRCPWLGGEAVSLNTSFLEADTFRTSGYEEIVTNASYVGGVVRQAGGLSFSRIFEAGHYPHGTQQETIYRILHRLFSDLDLATGTISTKHHQHSYRTTGPLTSWQWRNMLEPEPAIVCSVWQTASTCTPGQIAALTNGTAVVVEDYVAEPKPEF